MPQVLHTRWRRGEERLYAAALSGADVYELSVELVRRTVEHLRGLGVGSEPLLAASRRGCLVLEESGDAAGCPTCEQALRVPACSLW